MKFVFYVVANKPRRGMCLMMDIIDTLPSCSASIEHVSLETIKKINTNYVKPNGDVFVCHADDRTLLTLKDLCEFISEKSLWPVEKEFA